ATIPRSVITTERPYARSCAVISNAIPATRRKNTRTCRSIGTSSAAGVKRSIIVQTKADLVRGGLTPAKAPSNDAFDNQVIGGPRESPADAEVQFPLGRDVQVDRREDLLLLVGNWIEISDRPQRAVVLQAAGYFLRKVIRHFGIGREDPAFIDIHAMQRLIDSGIEREIPSPYLLVDDRAHLPRPGIFRILAALVSNFVRETQPHRPVPFLGNGNARTDMIADPVPAESRVSARESIKARLKPVGPALGDLDGFVESMVCRQHSVFYGLGSVNSKVRMEFHHRGTRLQGVAGVDLDLVVVLRSKLHTYAKKEQQEKLKSEHSVY